MAGKIFDIDESILQNRPKVRFRGKVYSLRDLTLVERLRSMREIQEQEEAMITATDPERRAEEYQKILASSVKRALDGVPDEVADSVTEAEFQLLTKALAHARSVDLDLVTKNEREVEEETEAKETTPESQT